MANDSELIIVIDGDTRDLERALSRVDEIGSAALGALSAGVAALGAGFVAVSTHSLKLASDLQEVQNVVDVTFGQGAKQIQEFADAAGETFGLSELQAKKYSSTLGAMMKSMGLTSDQVLDMSQSLTGLAGDFASFYNLDHEAAFEKIRSGLSGETEPLMQLGINMQVASLEAYALSKGIQTAFADMSIAEKTLLRYNYLLEKSADAQGDFARTADGYANQLRIAGMQVETLGVAFGETLLPVATTALGGIISAVKELTAQFERSGLSASVERVGQGFADIAVNITEGLVAVIPTLVSGLMLVFDNMDLLVNLTKLYLALWAGAKISGLIAGIVTALNTATTSTGLLTTATQALNTAWLANPIGLVTRGLVILGTAITTLYHTNEEFRKGFIWAWNNIVEGLEKSVNAIVSTVFKPFISAYAEMLKFFGQTPAGVFNPDNWTVDLGGFKLEVEETKTKIDELNESLNGLGTGASTPSNQVVTVNNQVTQLRQNVAAAKSEVAGIGSIGGAISGFSQDAQGGYYAEGFVGPKIDAATLRERNKATAEQVGADFTKDMQIGAEEVGSLNIGQGISTAIQGALSGEKSWGDAFADMGKNLLTSLANSMMDAAGSVLTSAVNSILKYVIGAFSGGFGIASPSKVFAEFGYWNMAGLGEGMADNAKLAIKPISDLKSSMSSLMGGIDLGSVSASLSPQLSPAMAGGGGTGNVYFSVVNNAPNTKVETEEKRSANGDIELRAYVLSTVAQDTARGGITKQAQNAPRNRRISR